MTTFALELKAFADKTKAENEAIARKILLDVYGELILRSPVDTGRFRANWNISTGRPDFTTVETTGTKESPAPARDPVSFALPDRVSGKVHFVSNGLPYAGRLETGWSRQAPSGLVKLTVMRWNDFLTTAQGEVRA